MVVPIMVVPISTYDSCPSHCQSNKTIARTLHASVPGCKVWLLNAQIGVCQEDDGCIFMFCSLAILNTWKCYTYGMYMCLQTQHAYVSTHTRHACVYKHSMNMCIHMTCIYVYKHGMHMSTNMACMCLQTRHACLQARHAYAFVDTYAYRSPLTHISCLRHVFSHFGIWTLGTTMMSRPNTSMGKTNNKTLDSDDGCYR